MQIKEEILAIVFGCEWFHNYLYAHQEVIVDIFYYKGIDYLLMVDYFSKYPEVARLSFKTSQAVVMATKDIYIHHCIPEKVIADCMPFNSLESYRFANGWETEGMTSSLHYPKWSGLVEKNVQTMKRLLKKANKSKQGAFPALVEFPNSPISVMEVAPAELLMGRNC